MLAGTTLPVCHGEVLQNRAPGTESAMLVSTYTGVQAASGLDMSMFRGPGHGLSKLVVR